MRKVTMIDPPHGWRYGFPKPLTLGEGQSLQDWLIENGYPQAEINAFGIAHLPCRYWTREIEEPPPYELNAHDIGERRKLILARRHVAALRANPELIIQAKAENDRQLASHRATIGNRAWRFLLRRSIDEIIAYMLQKSPTGRTLRSTSPFSMILPPEPEAERRRMWRAAKAELLADYLSGGKGIRNFQLRPNADRDTIDMEN
ncbi:MULTISPECIES: hypothetical protein [Sphingobium]|jgi:hypothetical protein|uniref:Uncharacterized protein n=3 Tax=Sphingobium yanoikuyae TaxID=13690 RepID=A0A084EP90_SPHYA|nr:MULTISPECIES: hypothetical protein [Sphingobium]KEZ19782.1 hypothetical protein CP98_01432 [Sphingobium yanoikuyae]QNG45208.1 hypothetical protein H3V42_25905 [Sphingobium yanoikuyae]